MRALCTYCSRSKSDAPGRIPSIERYLSTRIQKVHQIALVLESPFFVLSGRFGLVGAKARIPNYDHLLQADEVPALARKVAEQIRRRHIEGILYVTEPFALDPKIRPYHDALAAACVNQSIPLCVVEVGFSVNLKAETSPTDRPLS